MGEVDVIKAFEKAMREAGLTPVFRRGEGIEFGLNAMSAPHRFHVEGDASGTRNGWYVLFGDGVPAGEFGSWKTGAVYTWCSRDVKELTPAEREAHTKRIEAARKERERAQREREGRAAKEANLIWNDADELGGASHPYLQRKGVSDHGLRVTAWPVRNRDGEVFRHIENALLVPIMDVRGRITSLQAIFPEADPAFGRDKDFLPGGKKRGCFYMIGTPPAGGGVVCLAEGYATAATIHRATGWCAIVCWDAYNLPAVAEVLRAEMPKASFVIAADNDRWTLKPVENPGLTYAKRAAAEVGARVVVPEFSDLEGNPTDFNDLAARQGIEAVQAQVLPPVVKTTDSVPAPVPKAPAGYVSPIDYNTVDKYTPFPDIDGRGKPLPTATNFAEMVNRIDTVVRYNVIAKDIEILIPRAVNTIDNQKNAALSELHNAAVQFRMPTTNFEGNLVAVADANPYNPVATWIESKPWDGRSRLEEFYGTVIAKTDSTLPNGGSLKELLMRRWLISAVAAAFSRDGVVARGVLTFVSKQNLGKTYWAKRLAPRELGVIADGLILNPSDKDSVMACVSKWIVELGEVDATFRKSDIAQLKAFISKDRDALRRPYARAESSFGRRTVFFASVNGENFLRDETGNTRWWTIHVEALNNSHTIDMQQLWAEVLALYRAGESWHLTPEELETLNDHNEEYEAINPVHDMVDKCFDWTAPKTLWTNQMRATDIILASGFEKPTKNEVNEAAAYVVKKYGVERRKVGKNRLTAWFMPPKAFGSSSREDAMW